jgi:hypothetical protein
MLDGNSGVLQEMAVGVGTEPNISLLLWSALNPTAVIPKPLGDEDAA